MLPVIKEEELKTATQIDMSLKSNDDQTISLLSEIDEQLE